MSSLHIALVGATGNLGPAILEQLLAASLKLTVLARVGSAKKVLELTNSNSVKVREVDYSSQSSVVSALDTVDIVISTLGFANLYEIQKSLIDASIEAGVSRFIPSEFGNDSANPLVQKLPVFADKIKTQEYLKLKVAENPGFSYTFVYNNSFLDWQLQIGFMVNLKDHIATLYDGGDVVYSATRLSTIGRALAAIAKNLDVTKNRHIYVHDIAITQNQIIEIAKRIDGKEWATTVASTSEIEENSYQALKSSDPAEVAGSALGFIARACWGEGYGGDFSKKSNNDLLGLPGLSMEGLEDLVRDIIKNNST
ncbi:oxidoreductase [Fusarium mundagurra]|uniref:Oxidoreductase n=1 Tax=Fusarium mundagurra TaxID=1567541 RepID=A0A8H6D4Y6_9HYPO|nr:oxidoreductase [Fusarium mundagurra]